MVNDPNTDLNTPDLIDIEWQIAMKELSINELQLEITEGDQEVKRREQEVKKREQEITRLNTQCEALQNTLLDIKDYVSTNDGVAIAANASSHLLSLFEQAIEQGKQIRTRYPDVVSEIFIDRLSKHLSLLRGDDRAIGGRE